jgi:hypothetical protein
MMETQKGCEEPMSSQVGNWKDFVSMALALGDEDASTSNVKKRGVKDAKFLRGPAWQPESHGMTSQEIGCGAKSSRKLCEKIRDGKRGNYIGRRAYSSHRYMKTQSLLSKYPRGTDSRKAPATTYQNMVLVLSLTDYVKCCSICTELTHTLSYASISGLLLITTSM